MVVDRNKEIAFFDFLIVLAEQKRIILYIIGAFPVWLFLSRLFCLSAAPQG
jgi:hypothetical protein